MRLMPLTIIAIFIVAAGCNSAQRAVPSNGEVMTKAFVNVVEPIVLSGNASKYFEFHKGLYEAALSEGKVVYLEFYASWCPICREQEPGIFKAFNSLDDPSIVGFRVNYDKETELKKKYQIPYQHTRVIIKRGNVVAKATESWTSEQIADALVKDG